MLTRLTIVAAVLAACSSNNTTTDASDQKDAPKTVDGKTFNDAKVFMDAPKVFMDAPKVFKDAPIASTVNVVPNCTGVAAGDIGANITTTASDTFSPTTATITHGQYVKFTTSGDHNFENRPGAPADALFVSGSPGPHTSCLQFTAAGSFPWQCAIHGSMGMVGTLTVN